MWGRTESLRDILLKLSIIAIILIRETNCLQLKMLDSDFGSDSQKTTYYLLRHKFTLAYFLKNKIWTLQN